MSGRHPTWLDERDLLTIQDQLLSMHGGAPGLRDRALLESALARPRQHYAYAEGVDTVDLAAIYTSAIVQNHPFIDGNKRAGFVAGILFLELNGFDFVASEEEVISTVLALAAGDVDEDDYSAWLRSNVVKRKR